MKATLATITLVGLTAAIALASPGRDLNKRRVEKKRDAGKTEATAPATVQPAAPSGSRANPPAPARGAAQPAPPAVVQPAPVQSGPSQLTRDGKPPSHRFFSRVRTDSSREAAKAKSKPSNAESAAESSGQAKNLIYRRTWGAPSRHRPR